MKIKKVRETGVNEIYIVTFVPNWIERLFGVKEKEEEYKSTSSTYDFGGGGVYLNRNGKQLGNHNSVGEAIDRHKRKW